MRVMLNGENVSIQIHPNVIKKLKLGQALLYGSKVDPR